MGDSDNYKKFHELYAASQDKVAAVKGTWTGTVAEEYGFAKVSPDEVEIIEGDGTEEDMPRVYALFRKANGE